MSAWYRFAVSLLEEEPATWLAYLHGQQFHNLPHLTNKSSKSSSTAKRVLAFYYHLLKRTKFKPRPSRRDEDVEVLIYAGTRNQFAAVESTLDKLGSQIQGTVCLVPKGLPVSDATSESCARLFFTPYDVLRITLLTLLKGRKLISELKRTDARLVSHHLTKFLEVYSYIILFYSILKNSRPKLVLTANDHSGPNRALVSVANKLGIETAYLQHASVSSIFPALDTSYAFLDGRASFDIYTQCVGTRPTNFMPRRQTHAFLTGQKKILRRSGGERAIGLALNALNAPEKSLRLLNKLTSAGWQVNLRWHPSQNANDIEYYRRAVKNGGLFSISDPATESVAQFLSKVSCVIAGDSSIHLEAALADVLPIYYDIDRNGNAADYYGYVKHGVAANPRNSSELIALLADEREDCAIPYKAAVQYYSATYGTEWSGHEGDLVASHIQRLLSGAAPDSLWGYAGRIG